MVYVWWLFGCGVFLFGFVFLFCAAGSRFDLNNKQREESVITASNGDGGMNSLSSSFW